MSRINCHSAFKHYEMFHSRGGDVINIGSNNTTIFNMGAGFGGGNFWSGLGYGLGNGLGSIFGGLFGGNMGGFGNFGFGMSPFGMGGFGFGMSPFGLGNIFGGGSNRVDSHSDGKGKVKDSKDDKHDCDDPDQKKIIGFMDDLNEINKLNDKGKANEDKVKAKYKEILDAKENQDKYDPAKLHKKENTAAYDKLLNRLQDIAEQNGWANLKEAKVGIDDNADANPVAKVDDSNKKNVVPTEQTSETTPGSATGKIDTANLTAEQINALTPEQILNLTPDEAKSLLGKLGALNKDGDGVNATTNYTKLLLAQKSGLPLSCGHNASLDNLKGADAYLKGKVSNVTLNGDDITFEIETDNVKLKMKCKADSSSYEIDETIEQKSEKYKDATKGTKYELKPGQEYAERTGAAAMKRN